MNQSPAELRNAAARQLIARGKLRQALDVLNEAIRLDPRLPDSYINRAEVFDQLGMAPQADADRRKFAALGGVIRPEEAEAGPPPPKAKVRRRPPIQMRYPSPPKPKRGNAIVMQNVGTALIVVGLLVAAGIGIYLALTTLSDAINGSSDASPASETPAASGTPAPTDSAGNTLTPSPSIAPTPESLADALNGSPYSFNALQTSWQGKGITATATEVNASVTGCATTPVSVTISKGGAEMHLAVLFYDAASDPGQDWNLGAAVTPKDGRSIPGGAVAWYNANVVVVVLDQDATIKPDAFDAFVNLG